MKIISVVFILGHLAIWMGSCLAATDNSWDFLLLTQQWVGGVCATMNGQACVVPANVNRWSIHGLWPNYMSGHGPSFCNASDVFNIDNLRSQMFNLEKAWPTLYEQNTCESFWKHEWDKHGTCASEGDRLLRTQLDYFTQTFMLHSSYDIMAALDRHQVVPSDSQWYSASAIEEAIAIEFGVYPLLQCVPGTSEEFKGKTVLYQMLICFSSDLQMVMCPINEDIRVTCKPTDEIYYPTKPANTVENSCQR